MTVFIAQQPRPNRSGWMPDLSSAAEYGPFEYVFEPSERVYALIGPSMFKARKLFKDFDYEKDYFLWPGVGDPAALVVCTIALRELNVPYIKMLYWDRKRMSSGERDPSQGFYVPIKITIQEQKPNDLASMV